jgi:hypothetical protein
MNNFEFVKYEVTPNDNHLGIATVKAFGKIILRLKIVEKKSGDGYFPTAPSIRMGIEPNITYVSSFMLDSRSDEEELMNIVRNGIRPHMSQPKDKDPNIASTLGSSNVASTQEECPF